MHFRTCTLLLLLGWRSQIRTFCLWKLLPPLASHELSQCLESPKQRLLCWLSLQSNRQLKCTCAPDTVVSPWCSVCQAGGGVNRAKAQDGALALVEWTVAKPVKRSWAPSWSPQRERVLLEPKPSQSGGLLTFNCPPALRVFSLGLWQRWPE